MGWDIDSIIKLVVLLVVVFGGVIQFLYRNFFKPLAEAEAKRRREQAGGKPPQTLRDLLAEIRGEAPRQPEARPQGPLLGEPPPPPRAPRRDLVWEAVEEVAPPDRTPPVAPPLPSGGRERARPGGSPARPRTPRRQKPVISETVPRVETPARGLSVESRTLRSGIEERFKGSAGREQPAMRPLSPHLPAGLTLREAVIAQVILGPPRCRDRYAPSSSTLRQRPPAAARRVRS